MLITKLQSAVITEGLRISAIVTVRLPRIAPDESLKFGDWVIPAGVSAIPSWTMISKLIPVRHLCP